MAEKYIYSLKEGKGDMKSLLGGKGANLAQMTQSGFPVPPGFIITTEVCLRYLKNPGIMNIIWSDVRRSIEELEKETGKGFNDGANPLLVSVRSGAPVSMPGMMETILNLGLNDTTVEALAAASGNRKFAFDSYRRFIQMFSSVVEGVDSSKFERVLEDRKKASGILFDNEISLAELESIVAEFKQIYKDSTGRNFPSDPWDQLKEAIEAVFKSWNIPRAVTYRKINKISNDLGTAVNIIAMVYGNLGDDCGTGVCFTRNPSDGTHKLYGEFLINAQGEDVVAGIRTPVPISELEKAMPEIYAELCQLTSQLEKSYREMQDIEFTIERGKLYLLQTRTGKRTASAAVKIATDMVQEGLIDTQTAVSRITPEQVEQLLHRQIDKKAQLDILASGLPASPGAGTGVLVFDADEAEEWAKEGKSVILARPETCPDDIHGLFAAVAVVTSRGGMTSHAAVVARGMGKPAVCGCEEMVIDLEAETLTARGRTFKKGDFITVDGSSGNILAGAVPLIEATFTEDFKKVLGWADGIAKLQVWANADTPDDARRACEFGAKGIGLCRTEHMFMAIDRLPVVQDLIVADTLEERLLALDKLKVMQKSDFLNIFKAMGEHPVIIRLLDPPLHEFMPKEPDILEELAELEAKGDTHSSRAVLLQKTLSKVRHLHESNPMLGFRGCRLGIVYPEIYEMQIRAILEAVAELHLNGVSVHPEIMIPLVGTQAEMKFFRDMTNRIGDEVMKQKNINFDYFVGTMIELPRAALVADQLAQHAQFFSFGTNDLTQTALGFSRDDAEGKFLFQYIEKGIFKENPFSELDREGVGGLMKIACEKGRSVDPHLSVGICGEHGGNPSSIAFCNSIGMNYVSCSPFRIPVARVAAAHSALGILK